MFLFLTDLRNTKLLTDKTSKNNTYEGNISSNQLHLSFSSLQQLIVITCNST